MGTALRIALVLALLMPSTPGLAAPHTVSVAVAAAPTTLPLVPGWNLLSLPLTPDTPDPAVVLGSIAGHYDAVEAFDGCNATAPRRLFDPSAPPASNSLTAIDQRIGFWVKATSATSLTLSGSPPTSTTIQLCRGLNLIGYPLAEPLRVTQALAPIAGKYTRVYGYDAADTTDPWEIFDVSVPDFANDLQTMQPGRGYYILATEDTPLVLAETVPSANLNGLTEGLIVTQPMTITGSVDVPGLVSWRLEYRLQGDPTFTTFGTGTTPVANGPLGTFDPTLLLNGLYEIRLVTTDLAGIQSAVADVGGLVVEGWQKIGNFALAFSDLEVPVAGLPIQLVRTYDSRDKRVGDFGVGWTLGLRDVRVQESAVLGENWAGTHEGSPLFNLCVRSNKQRLVTVTLPGGSVQKFEPTLTPECAPLVAPDAVTIGFRALPGTTSSLAILGENSARVVGAFPGTVTLVDSALNPIDPKQYQLTMADGRKLDIDDRTGLQKVTDLTGSSLTITSNGIIHSGGKSVTFTRDLLGRITQITDPAGHQLAYTYTADGDLAQMTDPEGNATTFAYNGAHGLLDVNDPLGRPAIRSEYDADGRLVAVTDARGNRVTLAHDLASRRETMVDRLGQVALVDYDQRGNVLRRTDALGHTTAFTYDVRDNKLSETDPLGQTTSFIYDARDNLLSRTDPAGGATSFTYDANVRPLTATDALGRRTTFTYSNEGDLLQEADPLGNLTQHTYDAQGNRLSTVDALGNRTSFVYDASGNRIRTIDPLGGVTDRTYDANNNVLTQSTTRLVAGVPQPVVQRFAYDANNRLVETTDADGGVTRVAYTRTGKLASRTDPRHATTTYAYDEMDQPVRATSPDGKSVTATYDAEGRPIAVTNRAGRTTGFAYDPLGRRVQATLPDGSTVRTTFDAAGRKTAETDENGNTTAFGYDAAGRNTSIRDPLGHTRMLAYDLAGQVIGRTDRNGQATTFAYDQAGRQVRTSFADGTATSADYDAVGRLLARTDPAGNTTRMAYDRRGALIEVTDALGQQTRFAYDELGNQISQTDALGNVTSFTYDRTGHRIDTVLPLGQTETRTYDASGNLVALRDFNGATSTLAYDDLGRRTRRTLSSGETLDYTYTPTGGWATLADARGVTTITSDLRDRPTRVQYPDGADVRYGYDLKGNRTSVTSAAGTTVYQYNASNRLVDVTDAAGRHTSYSYDAEGNRAGEHYANGVTTTYQYDVQNRLTNVIHRLGSAVLGSYAYTLGPAGNRTRTLESSGRTVDYAYDALYRLTGETVSTPGGGTAFTSYAYDAAGNRTSRTDPNGTTPYAYDANSRLTSAGATAYAYDANGNTLSRGGSTFQYDVLNRLVQATAPGGTVSRYAYDAFDDRLQTVDAAGTTDALVDPFDPSGMAQVLRETTAASTTDYVYGHELISSSRGPAISTHLTDGQLSTRLLADAAGEVTDTYDYDAFGDLLARTGTTSNAYLYNSQQRDSSSGLYYLRARYYEPGAGRFLTTDPVAGLSFEPRSLQKYAYANDDPLNRADPTGEFTLAEESTVVAEEGELAGSAISPVWKLVTVRNGVLALAGVLATACTASITNSLADAAEEAARDAAADVGLPVPDTHSRFTVSPCMVNTMAIRYYTSLINARADFGMQRGRLVSGPPAPLGISVESMQLALDLELALDFLTVPARDILLDQLQLVRTVGGVHVEMVVAQATTPAFVSRNRDGWLRGARPPFGPLYGTRFTVVVWNLEGSNLLR